MSNLTPGEGKRDTYVKDAGNDGNLGLNAIQPKATLAAAADASMSRTPPPSLFSPAAIVDSGASSYVLSGTFAFPDNVQGALGFSSIAADPTFTGGTLINAAENAQLSTLSISTNTDSGMIAYSTNSKSRTALETKAIILNGPNQKGISVDGTSDQSFSDVGQIQARYPGSVGLEITSSGAQPRYHQMNEFNSGADNCTAIKYSSASGGTAAFRAGALTYEEDGTNPDTGAGCQAVEVTQGTLSGYCAEIRMETVCSVSPGAFLVLDALLTQGDISNDGDLNISVRKHEGGVLNTGNMTVVIDDHSSGVVVNSGVLNGQINGVFYGTWVQGSDYLATFRYPGFVQGSYENMGYVTLDGSVDAVTSITIQYNQETTGSRTVDFRLIDPDTSTVYWSGSNTTSIDAVHRFNASLVNALPLFPVNLSVEIQDNGIFVSDASVSLYFTRTPV